MTIFLGIVLLVVIYNVIGQSRKWWQFVLGVLLAMSIAGCMMLSYWDRCLAW